MWAAARAASTKPVTAIPGDVESLGALDRLLGDHGTVIVLGDAPNAALLLEHTDRSIDVKDFPGKDAAWLGRHIARTKLGLALGAGGAKGYAHVGALYELEAAGYTVDYVAGSSIGAIVGACIAMGLDARTTQ